LIFHRINRYIIFHLIGLLILFAQSLGNCQEPEKKESSETLLFQNKIENLAESFDQEIDYSDMIEELEGLKQHPINLNSATDEDLQRIVFLSDLQRHNLIAYILTYGNLLSLYELQLIEGFSEILVDRISPYVTITGSSKRTPLSLKNIFKYGRNQIFIRHQRILEGQAGYAATDDSALLRNPNQHYLGSKDKIYTRYGFNYKNQVRWGITAEKDAGEVFFKDKVNDSIKKIIGNKLRSGFDFNSGYLYLKDVQFFKTIVLGDYHLQFGQGLTLWSNLAFGKSSDAIRIARYPAGIKPSTSVNENGFFRGIATKSKIGRVDITGFVSRKKCDANITSVDSLSNDAATASSLQNTGYHRTPAELENKNAVRQTIFGGHICYKNSQLKVGLTAFKTNLSASLESGNTPYKKFDFKGKSLVNAGVNYSYLFRNLTFFGEIAMSDNGGLANLMGVNMNLDPRIFLVLLYRNYQKNYQNLSNNAFSDNSRSVNEEGIYTGFKAHLHDKWTLSGYIDQFNFPWLKFRTNSPSKGNEFLLQSDHYISRKIWFYLRYRLKNKQLNSDGENYISKLKNTCKQTLRLHLEYRLTPAIFAKNRVELLRMQDENIGQGNGYMIYQDITWKPMAAQYSIHFRYALFDTDGYDERIYAYENDVLYSFSIPAYYYKGSRIYILFKSKLSRNIELWFRFAQTFFNNRTTTGTGLDEIYNNVKSEIKTQIRIKF